MIETTVGNLLSVKPILTKLANTPMPAKEGYKVLRILKAIDKEYESINETQKRCLDKYAKKDENGNYMSNDDGTVVLNDEDGLDGFDKEWTQLLETKIGLTCEKFSLAALESMEITPAQLMTMENFMEE